MNRRCVLCRHALVSRSLSACILLAMCVTATGSTVVSGDYQIWGGWTERWFSASSAEEQSRSGSFSYSAADMLPLSVHEISSPHEAVSMSAALDALSLSMDGFAGPHGVVFPNGDYLTYGGMTMYAHGRTRVQSEGETLAFNLSAGTQWNYFLSEQSLIVTLTDVTSATNLITWDLTDPADADTASRDYSMEIDPAHDYEFVFDAFIIAADLKEAHLSASVAITLIPEPSAFSLLGLSFLAGVTMRRMRLCSRSTASAATSGF